MPKAENAKTKKQAPPSAVPEPIRIIGARTHTLRNVSVSIPREALTVVSGVSGSGKSSLAFDTLFAEGQRRYVESLSTYARQFLERLPRPDVDEIDLIPPAIALEQKNSVKNARSTIGTATEINDYMRLLFAKAGRIVCPDCEIEVRRDTPDSALSLLRERDGLGSDSQSVRLYVLGPVRLDDPSRFPAVVDGMRREGYTRLLVEGALVDTTDPSVTLPASAREFFAVADRMVLRGATDAEASRLRAAVELAFRLGHGRAVLRREGVADDIALQESLTCRSCGREFREPEPQLFSFYHPVGACKTCQGYGRTIGPDWDKIIPNPALSVADRCVAPWNTPTHAEMYEWLELAIKRGEVKFPIRRPFQDLSEEHRKILIDGQGDWPGIRGWLRWLEEKKYKVQNRILLARYRGYSTCEDCKGTRLVPEAQAVRVGGLTISNLWAKSVAELRRWFRDDLRLNPREEEIARLVLREIHARLEYLYEVGLGYLTLDRQTRTLSGGEAQRINLATALGSALTETMYVLDEPTVGLHPRDTDRLTNILKRLVGLANTVVVVEHDLDVIRAADHLIDMGPRAGEHGGQVVFTGKPAEAEASANRGETNSFTARALAGLPLLEGSLATKTIRSRIPRTPRGAITLVGARENNLRNVTVALPLQVLTCITGVSGSGKTSLISKCLYGTWRKRLGDNEAEPGLVESIQGLAGINDIIFVDQTPIGRSARSNPATYLKAWDGIRDLYGSTRDAKRLGLRPRDFSFNVEGGRCETCEGSGVQVIDMQFLADVEVPCERCGGRKFQERVLEARWNDKSVTEILDMTVEEALAFFKDESSIARNLQPLADVGLGYLRLGQSTATLSGGEAQRLKLALYLFHAGKTQRTLLLFDEPTTGLHPADLELLLRVFDRLLDKGFSLVVIEHNLELIARADWIIDLGPDGGDNGGALVVEGPPSVVAAHPHSHTGRFLRSRVLAD